LSITAYSQDKLKRFVGEWKLKDDTWTSQFDGKYSADVNPNRSFVVTSAGPENTILWKADYGGGFWATLLWTYHQKTGKVNSISNTEDNNIGIGSGEFNVGGDLVIKIVYPHGCTSCHRIYTFHWVSDDEFIFKSTIYKDGKLTDDFYGATFLRKKN
jgi:hypothetical protein